VHLQPGEFFLSRNTNTAVSDTSSPDSDCAAQHLPDCPLTFANNTFLRQTGYELSELIGRNCRFLQCAETSREVIAAMGAAFKRFQKRRRPGCVDFGGTTFRCINAKKDGTRFLNLVHMAPIYDKNDKLVRIMGCQFGLALVAGKEMQKLFQGVISPETLVRPQRAHAFFYSLARLQT
jgi:PAS domain S-box-containing protein